MIAKLLRATFGKKEIKCLKKEHIYYIRGKPLKIIKNCLLIKTTPTDTDQYRLEVYLPTQKLQNHKTTRVKEKKKNLYFTRNIYTVLGGTKAYCQKPITEARKQGQ